MSALHTTRNAIRVGTVVLMATAVIVATADGFAQSYAGLLSWASAHKLSGWKANSFPLLVDLFILVGELGLFLLALDGHKLTRKALSWVDIAIPFTVAAAGWGVSLWFNVNHVKGATTEDKVTAGVPPVTAMVGLLILLRTVHRYMAKLESQEDAPEIVTRTDRRTLGVRWKITGGRVTWSTLAFRVPGTRRPVARWSVSLAQAAGNKITPIVVPVVGPALPKAETKPEPPANPVSEPPHPEPEPEKKPTPEPDPEPGKITYAMRHPKWDEGVRLYRESIQGMGKPLSQRDLATAMGMKNRSLAKQIIDYVKEETSNGHNS